MQKEQSKRLIITEKPQELCPPFCNSTNVCNKEFFKKIQHKEIMDPGPWKSPLMQEANKGLDKINRAVPTVAGPYGPAYLIGGRFWYLPRGRKFMSNIEKFTLLPTHSTL